MKLYIRFTIGNPDRPQTLFSQLCGNFPVNCTQWKLQLVIQNGGCCNKSGDREKQRERDRERERQRDR